MSRKPMDNSSKELKYIVKQIATQADIENFKSNNRQRVNVAKNKKISVVRNGGVYEQYENSRKLSYVCNLTPVEVAVAAYRPDFFEFQGGFSFVYASDLINKHISEGVKNEKKKRGLTLNDFLEEYSNDPMLEKDWEKEMYAKVIYKSYLWGKNVK